LPTHGRLLNAVRNPADRRADTTMLRHIIKQLKMVDVHQDILHGVDSAENAHVFLFTTLCVELVLAVPVP
jgi:hypothetical protein